MNVRKFKLGVLGLAAAGLFAFNATKSGSIKGTVTPADAASTAWAVSSTDTLKAPIDKGAFEITNAKAGTYKVIIEAKPPFKNAAKDGITVSDGQSTDAGEIKLQQ